METLSLFDDDEQAERSAEQKGKRSHAEIEAHWGYVLYTSVIQWRKKLDAATTKEDIAHYQALLERDTLLEKNCEMRYTPSKEKLSTAEWQNRKKR